MTRRFEVLGAWRSVILAAVLASIFAIPAHAQFVCGGSANGGAPQDGGSATATGSINNVACGSFANASGALESGNTAFGQTADARGDFSFNTAVGRSNARGNSSANTASGEGADAHGDQSANTATGALADAHGNNSDNTATGIDARAFGDNSNNAAMGRSSDAHGGFSNNTAAGPFAKASGNGSSNVAMGDHADAHGDNSNNIAIGANSLAANNSVAFGAGAQAAFVNSAAFGNGAVATRANQQVFGTLSNTYSMPGLPSAASRAAQAKGTELELVTTDPFGNLAAMPMSSLGLASATDVTALSANVDQLNRRISKANTGVAMAFALAGVPTLLPGKKFALSANWGTFDSENGAALSGAMRVYHDVQFNASFAYGFRENIPGGRIGVSCQW
jgi:hypothetical protein